MPFSIVRDDIAHVHADVLVNAANAQLAEGGGVCGALFAAAGRADMRAACAALGGCPTGGAVVTPAFRLPARWVVHAVGPVWHGGAAGEEAALRSCYRSIFARVVELGAHAVAYPLISAGIYGYPSERALAVAREETRAFLEEHDDVEVTLVVFEREVIAWATGLADEIEAFIDDAYVETSPFGYGRNVARRAVEFGSTPPAFASMPLAAPDLASDLAAAGAAPGAPAAPADDLAELLDHLDASFSQTLLALIDERDLTDAQVYHRANLSRQLFSKIRSNPSYRPTKPTAVALAFALELPLDATQDLLARAGLTLSRSNRFDVIVRFFIERGIYDTFRLNEVLFAYDQPLVGSH